MRRFTVEKSPSLRRALEPEENPDERRLPAAVGAGDGHELAFAQPQVDSLQNALAWSVPEGDILELDG
jgi:hypothetical protein